MEHSPDWVRGVETKKVYSPTSFINSEGMKTRTSVERTEKSVKTIGLILDGDKKEYVALSKEEISEEPIVTVTELAPAQLVDTLGITLIPHSCATTVDVKKMQNKNVNTFLYKTIK